MIRRTNSQGSINKNPKKNNFVLTKEKSQPEFRRTKSKEKLRKSSEFPEFLRNGSRDNVRKIVEKEGKIARNLVAWSVPSEQDERSQRKRGRSKQRSPKNNQTHTKSSKDQTVKKTNGSRAQNGLQKSNARIHEKTPSNDIERPTLPKHGSSDSSTCSKERETKSEEYQERIRKAIEKGSEETKASQRPSSATSFQSQKNLRARYWSYLFDNLHRAVDEIYATCENDESIIECKEVIMMLDSCKRDFTGLIHRLEVFNQFETSDVRPQSLAWEVRKQMSPGKCSSPTLNPRRSPSPAAARFLNFGSQKCQKMAPFSWADRVRGFSNPVVEKEIKDISVQTNPIPSKSIPCYPSPVMETSIENPSLNKKQCDEHDEEGWEIVTKGRSRSKGSNFSNSSNNSSNYKRQTPQVKVSNSEQAVNTLKSGSEKKVNEESSKAEYAENEDDKELTSKLESLSRSSTIIEEYLDYNMNGEVSDTMMQSTSSFNMDGVELAFGLTESEIQIKEEQEKALASVIAEEETLTKELEEEALKVDDDDVCSDRDYTVSDGRETPKDLSDEIPLDSSASFDENDKPLTWEEMCQQYDRDHESGMSMDWGDIMDLSESVRMPGRALEMHQKLSSPSRRKSRSESVKRSEERMARAERRRLRLLVEKCERLRSLSERVRTVRELKNSLIQEKEKTMIHQMKRAELNRAIMLQEKVRKAQEEEMKVNEIAFINSLEAQNKRMEVQEKHQISEARRQELIEERQRRKEDKLAKEEAAQERRKQLEQERLARLQEIKKKRGNQAAKWQRERNEREKAREELAKERQRGREMKVAARNEALQQATEELQKRIEQKHIESTKRHEQKLTEVKEKSRAASSSRHATFEETPSAVPYKKIKKCNLCDVEIVSDVYMVSHLKGKQHKAAVKEVNKKITDAEMEAFSSKYISDVDGVNLKKQKEKDDREKTFKKRGKKLKTRMANKGREFESSFMTNVKLCESPKRGKLQKMCKELTKVLQGHSNGPWPSKKVASVDKVLGEISRAFEGPNSEINKRIFCQIGGLSTLSRILLLWDIACIDKTHLKRTVPSKLIRHTTNVILISCKNCVENCQYMLLSNKLSVLVDLLAFVLHANETSKQDNQSKGKEDQDEENSVKITDALHLILEENDESGLLISLLDTIRFILIPFCPKWPICKEKKNELTPKDMHQRLIDLVNYVICENIPEKLTEIISTIHGPVEDQQIVSKLQSIVHFFQPLTSSLIKLDQMFHGKKEESALVCQSIRENGMFGLVSLPYSLLYQGTSTRIAPSPLPLAEFTVSILEKVFQTLNIVALLDVENFQKTLSSDGISFQYRSITAYLLRYTSINERSDNLLHEVIINVGFFTAANQENQLFLQCGRGPSILHQLCTLPFGYFSDPKLRTILFPTLISICFKNLENKEIVSQDLNPSTLSQFIEEQNKEPIYNTPKSVEDIDGRSSMLLRFPKSLYIQAQDFFKENKSKQELPIIKDMQSLTNLPAN